MPDVGIRVAVGQFHELTEEKLRFAAQIGVKGIQMNNPTLPGDTRWEEQDIRALVDKTANLRDIADAPPVGWSLQRRSEYFDWAAQVVDQIRGTHPQLEALFDAAYAQRPT